MGREQWSRAFGLLLAGLVACTGQVIDPPGATGPGGRRVPPGSIDPGAQGTATAIPRLSRREMEAVISEVFGIEGVAERILPEDADLAVNPATSGEDEVFDTFVGTLGTYVPSEVFVSATATLAFEIARDASADTALIDSLAGCTPTGPDDADCMGAFIDSLALRLYHRPLTDTERPRLVASSTTFAAEGGFYLGARVVIQSMLTSPAFIYRQEIGEDLGEGFHKLDNFELVAKLSFFLWGAPPTDALLEQASGPEITDEALVDLVNSMVADPLADAQIRRFHTQWLRYQRLLVTDPDLRADMLAETEALVDRVVTDGTWSELFTSTETYVTPALATHYGMSAVPSSPGWVPYDNDERAGVLAHGSFLSLSSTQTNGTLPSRRGAMISRRILCLTILPPPPDVDVDDGVEVPDGACKYEAYQAHRAAGSSCNGCHESMDAIGFGFERFDGLGVYRTTERLNTDCSIDGAGSAAGGDFSGPRQFATVVRDSGNLTDCGTQQLMRFALRRQLASEDSGLADRMHTTFVDSGEDFRSLVIGLALDPTFRHRMEASP